jgi:hypothetical protein
MVSATSADQDVCQIVSAHQATVGTERVKEVDESVIAVWCLNCTGRDQFPSGAS